MTTTRLLFRRDGWQLFLDSVVYTRMHQPFTWGSNDCALFAADCVQAITGVDLAQDLRGLNAHQALRALRRHGGLAALASRALGVPAGIAQAEQGDVVLLHQGKRDALAVCLSSTHAAGPTRRGLGQLPVTQALCCWKVG